MYKKYFMKRVATFKENFTRKVTVFKSLSVERWMVLPCYRIWKKNICPLHASSTQGAMLVSKFQVNNADTKHVENLMSANSNNKTIAIPSKTPVQTVHHFCTWIWFIVEYLCCLITLKKGMTCWSASNNSIFSG